MACGLRVAAGNDRVNRVSGPVCEVGEREKCIFFIVIFQQGKIPCPGSERQGRAGPDGGGRREVGGEPRSQETDAAGKKWWWVSASECRCSDEFWVHRAVGRWEAGGPQPSRALTPPVSHPHPATLARPLHRSGHTTHRAPATLPRVPVSRRHYCAAGAFHEPYAAAAAHRSVTCCRQHCREWWCVLPAVCPRSRCPNTTLWC